MLRAISHHDMETLLGSQYSSTSTKNFLRCHDKTGIHRPGEFYLDDISKRLMNYIRFRHIRSGIR